MNWAFGREMDARAKARAAARHAKARARRAERPEEKEAEPDAKLVRSDRGGGTDEVLNRTSETQRRGPQTGRREKEKCVRETKESETKKRQGNRPKPDERRKAVLNTTYDTPPTNTKPSRVRAKEYREARVTTLWLAHWVGRGRAATQ